MSDIIHLSFDGDDLVRAIAVALVERGTGRERLQAIESKQVSHHIKSLLTEMQIESQLMTLVNEALRTLITERVQPKLAKIDDTVTDFFRKSGGMMSRAEEAAYNVVTEYVRKRLYDKQHAIAAKLEEITDGVIEKLQVP